VLGLPQGKLAFAGGYGQFGRGIHDPLPQEEQSLLVQAAHPPLPRSVTAFDEGDP
jgi:hypothetical protein